MLAHLGAMGAAYSNLEEGKAPASADGIAPLKGGIARQASFARLQRTREAAAGWRDALLTGLSCGLWVRDDGSTMSPTMHAAWFVEDALRGLPPTPKASTTPAAVRHSYSVHQDTETLYDAVRARPCPGLSLIHI